jgi:hypothetical protein
MGNKNQGEAHDVEFSKLSRANQQKFRQLKIDMQQKYSENPELFQQKLGYLMNGKFNSVEEFFSDTDDAIRFLISRMASTGHMIPSLNELENNYARQYYDRVNAEGYDGGPSNSTDANMSDTNSTNTNSTNTNSTNTNSTDANMSDANMSDTNSTDTNSTDTNTNSSNTSNNPFGNFRPLSRATRRSLFQAAQIGPYTPPVQPFPLQQWPVQPAPYVSPVPAPGPYTPPVPARAPAPGPPVPARAPARVPAPISYAVPQPNNTDSDNESEPNNESEPDNDKPEGYQGGGESMWMLMVCVVLLFLCVLLIDTNNVLQTTCNPPYNFEF